MPCDGSFQYSSAPVSFWQITFAPKEHNSTTCRDASRNCGLSGKEIYRIRIPHSSGDARWRMLAHTTVQDRSVLLHPNRPHNLLDRLPAVFYISRKACQTRFVIAV